MKWEFHDCPVGLLRRLVLACPGAVEVEAGSEFLFALPADDVAVCPFLDDVAVVVAVAVIAVGP
jgi:hypothetical protein